MAAGRAGDGQGTRTSTPGLSCLSRALPPSCSCFTRRTSAGSPRPAA